MGTEFAADRSHEDGGRVDTPHLFSCIGLDISLYYFNLAISGNRTLRCVETMSAERQVNHIFACVRFRFAAYDTIPVSPRL